MKLSCTAAPLWLNGWKHHLNFLLGRIIRYTPSDEEGFITFCDQLKGMGSSVSDLYVGVRTPLQVREGIIQYLVRKKVLDPQAYHDWLESSSSFYRQAPLNDHSRWTLLKGKDPVHYVHVHPSRYSPHTLRINTNHLRSAVAWMAWKKAWPQERLLAETMGMIRSRYLGLSAVSEAQMQGIRNTIHLLERSMKGSSFKDTGTAKPKE